MTKHLPECPWFPNTHEDVSCRDSETLVSFCDALSACEQRVRQEIDREAFVLDEGDPYREVYRAGYRNGLDAAREAVAALPEYQMRDTCIAVITHYEGRKMMKQDDFSRGLWIGWTIGTSLMLIPLVVLVVTR